MATSITPTQSNVQAALRAFILNVLPGDPSAAPAVFTGTISGTTLTVTKVILGSIVAGAGALGAAPGTTITGPGALPNTYVVSPSQTVSNPTTMSTGVSVVAAQQNRVAEPANPYFVVMTPIRFVRLATNVDSYDPTDLEKTMVQNAEVVVQLDFHSPDSVAGDHAQTVATAFRDEYGVDFFAALTAPLNGVVPLYADDPNQLAFINAEAQYEWRWVLQAHLQVNQQVTVTQLYADSADLDVVDVTAEYPA